MIGANRERVTVRLMPRPVIGGGHAQLLMMSGRFMSRVEMKENVIAEILDGEAVLLDLDTGKYFALNGTAARAWQLLSERRSVEAVVDTMLSEFDVPREQLEFDVEDLIRRLEAHSLIGPPSSDG